ncbi:MAG: CHAT domain-containing protein, partial [Desulfobacterales bacterium]|nr:CHAT domain-containing protein [Desulfobacterales bacterium]
NACQSGMIDQRARDAFASVASSLIQSGVRGVVAMAYSLYVTGAQTFLPAFYRRLFDTGSVARAARAGRQQMFSEPNRVCARGKFPLQDWLVPVVYQQEPMDFSFTAKASRDPDRESASRLPVEARDEENPYGFIGRDGPILELERAMRSKTPGILIHGLGGVGKTTLARGFVKWLEQTQGLGHGCFWFAFNEIRNAEFVFNRMGEALFGGNFSLAGLDQRIEALASVFKQQRFLIIWDNFEVARGIPGTEVKPFLGDQDRDLL